MPVEDQFKSVDPIRPPAAYIGGKRRLAKRLVDRIQATPHRTYAEAFLGVKAEFFTFPDGRTVRKVGAHRSGRTIDGVVHDAFPRTQP